MRQFVREKWARNSRASEHRYMARVTEQLVTCREIAEILFGNPHAADAAIIDLTAKGVTILRDWADRPAITLSDATRVVGAEIRKQREQYEQYLADRELDIRVTDAQSDREKLFTRYYSDEMSGKLGSADDLNTAARSARRRVERSESHLPATVRKRLYWLSGIVTDFGQADG